MSPQAAARLKALSSAPLDSWVALSEDESTIVAVGGTYGEVVEKSEQAGVGDPLIVKTPAHWGAFSL
jgi:hypothetical protein